MRHDVRRDKYIFEGGDTCGGCNERVRVDEAHEVFFRPEDPTLRHQHVDGVRANMGNVPGAWICTRFRVVKSLIPIGRRANEPENIPGNYSGAQKGAASSFSS